MAALRSEAVLDRTVDVIREEERKDGGAASMADGVVLVDALGAVLWWSAGGDAALQRVGRGGRPRPTRAAVLALRRRRRDAGEAGPAAPDPVRPRRADRLGSPVSDA